MNSDIQKYIDSIEADNSKKVAKHVFKRIEADNIENQSLIQLEQTILDAKPNSPKDIITIIYILSSYARWLQEQGIIKNDNLYQILQSLDKKMLWKKAAPFSKKKFISFHQYKQITTDIATYEEYNALYYELLFSCIYYGAYTEDLSVIKNLRKSDIQDDGIVTLREDNGHVYKLKIPERLASDLKKLPQEDKWLRPNRFGLCQVDMRGAFPDSVFKVEQRRTSSEGSYRFSYYARLRKISKEYVGFNLSPICLYASGIMNRIKIELEKNGLTLEEAFEKNNRDKTAHSIIEKELIRCNSGIETGNFRELVKGHLSSF